MQMLGTKHSRAPWSGAPFCSNKVYLLVAIGHVDLLVLLLVGH